MLWCIPSCFFFYCSLTPFQKFSENPVKCVFNVSSLCSALHVQTVPVFGSTAVPATFKGSLKSQEAEEGNSVTLRCELSKKGVSLQWQREGQVLSEEIFRGKYQMKLEGKTAQMTILNVQLEDAGKYSCITGDEKTTAEVKVKRKFEPCKDQGDHISLWNLIPLAHISITVHLK